MIGSESRSGLPMKPMKPMRPMRPMPWQDESIAPALPSDPSSVVTEPERPVGRSPRRPSGRNTPRRVLSKTGATAEGDLGDPRSRGTHRRARQQKRLHTQGSNRERRISQAAPLRGHRRVSRRAGAQEGRGGTPPAAGNDPRAAPPAALPAPPQDPSGP